MNINGDRDICSRCGEKMVEINAKNYKYKIPGKTVKRFRCFCGNYQDFIEDEKSDGK